MGLTRIRAEQISDIDYKQSVRVIALENATLTGGAPAVVDGVSLVTGDRILVAAQDNAAENGLYQVQTVGAGSNGTWIRTLDANQDGEIQPGMVVMVTQGTEYADTPWKLVTNGVIEIGVTELTFEENYSLAFGNVFANGTAVIATAVSDGIVFAAGENVSITGNNTTKTVTISATGGGGGGGGSAIINGASNVNIATANADITMGVNGTANVVVVSSDGITVQGNITTGNILTDGYFFANGAPFTGSSGGNVDLSAVAQDIIPSANVTFDLGTASLRWRDLYLAGNTIDLGGAQIKADAASGAIALIPAATIAVPNPSALVISTTGGINVVTTDGGNISGNAIANAAATSSPVGSPRITQITVTDGDFDPTGATAVALEGGNVQITGNGFQTGCQAVIGSNNAAATGFESSELLHVTVSAQSAGSYIVFVVNPDGSVGLRPNGITYSGLPTWVTDSALPGQTNEAAFSIELEATSDSAVDYALAAGSSLPANVSLSSAGVLSGTVTQAESTVYSFTVVATDAESQASPRSFDLSVENAIAVDYLVIAGGGGGGSHNGGGGGAGGYRTSAGTSGGGAAAESQLLLFPATNYTVTVGAGGAGGSANTSGTNGNNSVFSTITSIGGGGGGGASTGAAGVGGSGGGSAGGATVAAVGTANQGRGGGASGQSGGGGGGGGASTAGNDGSVSTGGSGGSGVSSSITGTAVTRGGGGGAAGSPAANGGVGGGGNGGSNAGTAGTVNTGGGGGGGFFGNAGGNNTAAAGGRGVVILKYLNIFTISNPGGGLTFTTSTAVAGFKVTTFTNGTGNVEWN